MTDAGHVVVHVDVTAAVGIEQVDALAPDNVQRRVVEQRGARPEGANLQLESFVNRTVRLYGPMTYHGVVRTNYMTALQASLASQN